MNDVYCREKIKTIHRITCTCTPKKFTKNLSTEEKHHKNIKKKLQNKKSTKKESTGKKVHKEKIHSIIFPPTKREKYS